MLMKFVSKQTKNSDNEKQFHANGAVNFIDKKNNVVINVIRNDKTNPDSQFYDFHVITDTKPTKEYACGYIQITMGVLSHLSMTPLYESSEPTTFNQRGILEATKFFVHHASWFIPHSKLAKKLYRKHVSLAY